MHNTHAPILVFGATGRQGGAVAQALLQRGQPVRAFVRNPADPAAIALQQAGADMVAGSLDDASAIAAAMKHAHGVFSVMPATLPAEDEVRYGTRIADLAAENRVHHFIYSSGASASDTLTGIPRFDAKPRIEAHIRALALPASIIRPMIFMEMLLQTGLRADEGQLLSLIHPHQSIQLTAVQDIGKIVAALFADQARFAGQTLKIASDKVTGQELETAFSDALARPITYHRFPDEMLAANADLAHMASSLENGPLAEQVDFALMRELNPELLSLRAWLAGAGRAALSRPARP